MVIQDILPALQVKMTQLQLKALFQKIVRKFNSFTCIVMNGGHEMYTVRHEGGNLRDRCLLCQHETKGIAVGKKPNDPSAA